MRIAFAVVLALAGLIVSVAALAQSSRVLVSLPMGDEAGIDCAAGALYATVEAASVVVGCAVETATPAPSATPGGDWWLAGGVSPSIVAGAWRAKGAGTYAASLINAADPGSGDLYAPAAAPDWNDAIGWQGGQSKYLAVTGGMYPAAGWSYVMRVANAQSYSQQFMGCRNDYFQRTTGMDLNNTGAYQEVSAFSTGSYAGVVTTATMGLVPTGYYVDGVVRSPAIPAGSGACTVPLFILTNNWGGAPHGGSIQTRVEGVAVYSGTLTAGQLAAIHTEMASW